MIPDTTASSRHIARTPGQSPGQYMAQHGTRALSRWVRSVIPQPASLAKCGTPLPHTVTVPIHWSSIAGPVIRGLRQCKNRFICPYCSWHFRLALARRWERVFTALLDTNQPDTYRPMAFTVLTISHSHVDSLNTVRNHLLDAWRYLGSNRKGGSIRSRLGMEIFCWALDIVIGGPNGPHPHLNVAHTVSPEFDHEILEIAATQTDNNRSNSLAAAWHQAVKSRSYGARTTAQNAGAFITRISHDQTEKIGSLSGYMLKANPRSTAFEATENRFRQGGSGGRTIMELILDGYTDADRSAIPLLRDTALDLIRAKSYTESHTFRHFANHHKIPSVSERQFDAEAIYADQTDPEPFMLIRRLDYQAHRASFEDWADAARGLDRDAVILSGARLCQHLDIKPLELEGYSF